MQSTQIKVLLVDDHSLIREGIKSLIINFSNYQFQVYEADNGETALRLAAEIKPNIVIMDISLPDQLGVDTVAKMMEMDKAIKVIMLSMHSEYSYISKCLDAGVHAYVLKNEGSEITDALKSVLEGNSYYSSGVRSIIIDSYASEINKPKNNKSLIKLTKREKEIVTHVLDGYTSEQIGEILFISVKTVDTHRHNVMRKLQVKNTVSLLKKVNELELLQN